MIRLREITYFFILSTTLFLTCCSSQSRDQSDDRATVLPDEETDDIPDIRDNPENGDGQQGIIVDATRERQTTQERDFRPDALLNYTFPELKEDIDPRFFSPEGTYLSNLAAMDSPAENSLVLVPYDGRQYESPACSFPIPVPGQEQVTPSIDGINNEWSFRSVVAVDRKGDGPSNRDDLDLRTWYFYQDIDYYYFAIDLADDWRIDNDSGDRLIFSFSELLPPSSSEEQPQSIFLKDLEIFGEKLWENINGVYQELTPDRRYNYELAIKGQSIEFKLSKSAITNLTNNDKFVLQVRTFHQNSSQYDDVGIYILGLTSDYTCLIPYPDATGQINAFKMVHLHRTENVSVSKAEVIYRSMVDAIPAVNLAKQDDFISWDTFNVIAVDSMLSSGLFVSNIGIFMEKNRSNFVGEVNLPVRNFFVAAHEYAHGYNGMDYNLQEEWMREGHSNWIANKAVEILFGKNVSHLDRQFDIESFLQEEESQPQSTNNIREDAWGHLTHTPLYYYRKAAAFFSIMERRFDYQDFLVNLLQYSKQQPLDQLSFINQLKNLSSYIGDTSDDLQSGWFFGNYSDSLISANTLDDQDKDGLHNYLEQELTTHDHSIDSDNDGLSDTFEYIFNMNPLVENSFDYLAADNYMKDWDLNSPQSLITINEHKKTSSPCGTFSNIHQYGIYTTPEWLLVGIKFDSIASTDDSLQVVVFVNESADIQPQIIAPWGKNYFVIKNKENELIRSFQMISSFKNSQIEIPINFSWMNWQVIPEDLSLRIVTYANQQQCDYSDEIFIQSN